MQPSGFRIEPLDRHDRSSFECGSAPLNEYFQQQVGQDSRRRVTVCYVALEEKTGFVAGYYTLAACSVKLDQLPLERTKKLPRYPTVPAVRIGRLAVDLRFRSQRLGGMLVFDALERTCKAGIGAYAVVVDAKDDLAVSFYEHHGFIRFASLPNKLFLPISDGLQKLMR